MLEAGFPITSFRIVIQNERYEEWLKTMKQLRKLFNEYDTRVLNYHKRPCCKTPKAYNSTAAQGNFLETLNMTLNCKLFLAAQKADTFYAPNFEKVGDILVSACPYVCMYVCVCVFMFKISS